MVSFPHGCIAEFFLEQNMKHKSIFLRMVAVILLIALPFALFACGEEDNLESIDDDSYTLTLCGLVDGDGNPLADIVITKAQIKQLFAAKPVIYTDASPVFASDKTDDYGNKIPHAVKGVYLEDILAAYTQSATIDAYGSLTLNALDGYVTVATEEVFNSAGRGSKMIIALEYDGVTLTSAEKSGALRAVFPDQIANTWAKYLNKIEFSTSILQTPEVLGFTVLETITQGHGSYTGTATLGGEDVACEYFGLSLADLIEEEILNAMPSDKMHCYAWDYDSATDSYSEYSAWTKYDVYYGGWLLLERQIAEQQKEPLSRAPVFDGPDFSAGMTVKNILAVSVFHTSIVSFETAFTRFDTDAEDEFLLKNLLVLLNMFDMENNYSITTDGGQEIQLSASQMLTATVTEQDQKYFVHYGENAVEIVSLTII